MVHNSQVTVQYHSQVQIFILIQVSMDTMKTFVTTDFQKTSQHRSHLADRLYISIYAPSFSLLFPAGEKVRSSSSIPFSFSKFRWWIMHDRTADDRDLLLPSKKVVQWCSIRFSYRIKSVTIFESQHISITKIIFKLNHVARSMQFR